VTLLDRDGKALGPVTTTPTEAAAIHIDRGGFGVDVQLEKPTKVLLGGNSNLLIQIVEEGPKPTPANQVAIKYALVPFGN
jgi:hypothetical protein